MSVIVAMKHNNRIYMASDSQTSWGDHKINLLERSNRKIQILNNGILLAHTGTVKNIKVILSHSDFFDLPLDGTLTKKYIVQNIIPKLYQCYKENNLLSNDSEIFAKQLPDSYLIAYKDKLFLIDGEFDVTTLEHYAAIGSGSDATLAGLEKIDPEKSISMQLIDILKVSASRRHSVSGPYYIIDTEEQAFKVID